VARGIRSCSTDCSVRRVLVRCRVEGRLRAQTSFPRRAVPRRRKSVARGTIAGLHTRRRDVYGRRRLEGCLGTPEETVRVARVELRPSPTVAGCRPSRWPVTSPCISTDEVKTARRADRVTPPAVRGCLDSSVLRQCRSRTSAAHSGSVFATNPRPGAAASRVPREDDDGNSGQAGLGCCCSAEEPAIEAGGSRRPGMRRGTAWCR